MTPTLPDFDDERDTGRIATLSAEDVPDPVRELRRLRVQAASHEQLDARRWRITRWLFGVAIAVGMATAGAAWTANAQSAGDRARLEDVQARLDRIERQLDRLMERSEER